jgi:imidazolonepropionase
VTTLLVDGISELVTNDPAVGDGTPLGLLREAAIVVAEAQVAWVGPSARAPDADERIDLGGRAVLPGFVDSHSHLVFAGDRSAEFSARMSGMPYDGGGIAATVRATREAGDATLRHLVGRRVAEMRAQGTTTVEIKSGYGLTVEQEARACASPGSSPMR